MSTVKDMDLLLQEFSGKKIPGAGCIVMQKGKTLYEGYAGMADFETGRAVDESSIFRLFSMTKLIVCTAALIQFERGKYTLNDPYSDYYPEYKNTQVAEMKPNGYFTIRPAKRPILVKDTFNMACGLPYPSPKGEHPTDKAMNEVRARLAEEKGKYTLQDDVRAMGSVPIRYDPGTRWTYGFGHEMVAALVEATSGMSIGEFIKKEITGPLGMTSTAYRHFGDTAERMVKLYENDGKGGFTPRQGAFDERHQPDAVYEGGGAGLFSTVRDYAIFTQMLANGGVYNGIRIIGKNTIDLMRTNMLSDAQMQDFTNSYLQGYGYGLGVRTMMNIAGVSNSTPGEFGWTGAAGTWTSIDPENGFSVVYMHNTFPNHEEYHHMRVRAVAYGMLED